MKKNTDQHNEEELMRQLSAGNMKALETLYLIHSPRVFSYAHRILGIRSDAEDIVHEVFLKIWKYREKYIHAGFFRAWALRICANLCIDCQRKLGNKNLELRFADEVDADENSSPESIAVSNELLEKAYEAFRSLPYADQQILAFRFDGDLSVAETAENMGCSIRTVHYRTAQAINRLRVISGGTDENL